jgi:hypothetical protein
VHLLDVPRLLAAAAAAAAATAAAACLTPLTSHLAAVLALAYCAATQQLASGSEVRPAQHVQLQLHVRHVQMCLVPAGHGCKHQNGANVSI